MNIKILEYNPACEAFILDNLVLAITLNSLIFLKEEPLITPFQRFIF